MTYAILGAGAAVENVVPPVPADTFVLFGAFLSARGRTDPWIVFAVTWACNVGSALVVYFLARRYGRSAFETGLGKRLLKPNQLEQIAGFYSRWGTPAIFVSRFLPAFRAVVPVFAGVSHVSFWRISVPLASASALWYGLLVYLGMTAGRQWQAILEMFGNFNQVLLGIAAVLVFGVGVWWWRSRRGGS